MAQTGTFKLMALPAELRELVYYQAMKPITPIDTAAIPNTPDCLIIPSIAHLSKQTRHEALHILFKSRPVEISLHSDENLRRALLWAQEWQNHALALPQLIFSGRITQHQFEFFTITIHISDEAPFFRASAKRAASTESDKFIASLKEQMLLWLASQLSAVKEGREVRLSGAALSKLIELVAGAANSKQAGVEPFPLK